MVVEDDDGIRNTLHYALEIEGYRVLTAANGREALDVLSKVKIPCLILLDLMMPVMNGWEFLEVVHRDFTGSIPIAIVSAYLDQAKPVRAQAFIKKPIRLETLLEVVGKYCDKARSHEIHP